MISAPKTSLEMGLHELAAPPTVPHSTLTGARWPSKTTTNEVSKSWRRPGDRRCTCAAKHALLHPAPAASRARYTSTAPRERPKPWAAVHTSSSGEQREGAADNTCDEAPSSLARAR
jgi:hypothetical protein